MVWAAAHGVALVSLPFSGLPVSGMVALAAALLAHAGMRQPTTTPGFSLNSQGAWSVPAWDILAGQPARGSIFTPWVIRVVLRGPDLTWRVLIVPRDSVTVEQWRAIRTLLG